MLQMAWGGNSHKDIMCWNCNITTKLSFAEECFSVLPLFTLVSFCCFVEFWNVAYFHVNLLWLKMHSHWVVSHIYVICIKLVLLFISMMSCRSNSNLCDVSNEKGNRTTKWMSKWKQEHCLERECWKWTFSKISYPSHKINTQSKFEL